jgi:hypothetical protein
MRQLSLTNSSQLKSFSSFCLALLLPAPKRILWSSANLKVPSFLPGTLCEPIFPWDSTNKKSLYIVFFRGVHPTSQLLPKVGAAIPDLMREYLLLSMAKY